MGPWEGPWILELGDSLVLCEWLVGSEACLPSFESNLRRGSSNTLLELLIALGLFFIRNILLDRYDVGTSRILYSCTR